MCSLIDGVGAWRHFIVCCTEARFCMLLRTPNLLMSPVVQSFQLQPIRVQYQLIGTKLIFKRLNKKVTELDQRKRVRVPGLPEFLAEVGSEASDTESPCFKDVVSGGATQEALSGAGKVLLEEGKRKKIPTGTSSGSGRNLSQREKT